MLPNCPEFLYLWFGLAKLGAVEVPVNTFYKGEFLRHIVDQSDSKIFVIAHEFLDHLKRIEDALKKVGRVVVLGEFKEQEAAGYKIPTMSFEELFNASDDPVPITVEPWDPLSIIYISGTTGLSQGAVGPHKFWIVCAEKMLKYPPRRQKRYLLDIHAALSLQRSVSYHGNDIDSHNRGNILAQGVGYLICFSHKINHKN
jgi:crotonobetaine/carnitine-CoA ligase